MGRKRLMTVLAGVIAAVGLHIGPAAALDLGLPGVGDVKVETSDGLTVEADLDAGVDSVIKLTPKVEAELSSEPKLKVEDGAKVGDTEIDLGEIAKPVQDAVDEPAKTAPAPAPTAAPEDEPAAGGTGGSSDDRTSGSTARDDAAGDEVTTSGRSEPAMSPERAAQLDAFRALREADASLGGAAFDSDVVPGVQLAPRTPATTDDVFADAEVAPGVEVAAPSVADEQPQSAQLATTPFNGVLPEIPLALQLLAGTLVAGTALAWHLARRELSPSSVTRTSSR